MKKKDNLMNDAAVFFLVAVISVSLSVFVGEVNTIVRDSENEALSLRLAQTTTTTQAIVQNTIPTLTVPSPIPLILDQNNTTAITLLGALLNPPKLTLTTDQKKLLDFSGDGAFNLTDVAYALNAEQGKIAWVNLLNQRDNPTFSILDSNAIPLSLAMRNALLTPPTYTLTDVQKKLVDFNGDGQFTMADAILATRAEGMQITWQSLLSARDNPMAVITSSQGVAVAPSSGGGLNLDLRQAFLNPPTLILTATEKKSFDFNGDGAFTMADVVLLERAEAGLISWAQLFNARDNPLPRIIGPGATASSLNKALLTPPTLTLTDTQKKQLDFNGDGQFTIADVVLATKAEQNKILWASLYQKTQVTIPTINTTDAYPSARLNVNPMTLSLGQTTILTAEAYDDKKVEGVQFLVADVPQQQEDIMPPYAISFTPKAPGTYTANAVARDSAGQKITSSVINIIVTGGKIPYDSDGGKNYFVQGATTGLANCVDQSQCLTPVTRIDACWKDYNPSGNLGDVNTLYEFFIGSDGFMYGEPYQSPTGCENGAVKGFSTSTPPVDLPPMVSLSASPSSVNVGDKVMLTASTYDDKGIHSVQFMINGINQGSGVAITPNKSYNFPWVATVAGTYTASVIARDTAGQTTTSNSIPLMVIGVTAPTYGTGTVPGTVPGGK